MVGAEQDPSALGGEAVAALEVKGTFMFDPATHRDFLGAILGTGGCRPPCCAAQPCACRTSRQASAWSPCRAAAVHPRTRSASPHTRSCRAAASWQP